MIVKNYSDELDFASGKRFCFWMFFFKGALSIKTPASIIVYVGIPPVSIL